MADERTLTGPTHLEVPDASLTLRASAAALVARSTAKAGLAPTCSDPAAVSAVAAVLCGASA